MSYYFHIQSFSISLFGFVMFHIFSFSSHSVDVFHSRLLGLPNFPHGVSSGLSRCLIRPWSVVWASRPVELQIRLDLKEESCCASSSMAEEWQNLSLSLFIFSSLCHHCCYLSLHLFSLSLTEMLLFPPYVLIRLSLHPPVHSGKGGRAVFEYSFTSLFCYLFVILFPLFSQSPYVSPSTSLSPAWNQQWDYSEI